MCRNFIHNVLLFFFIISSNIFSNNNINAANITQRVDNQLSPATKKALKQFKLNYYEGGTLGSNVGEMLLTCSYCQDIWLTYLQEAESLEDYQRGMELLHVHAEHFYSTCRWTASVLNFYTGEKEHPTPQTGLINFKGRNIWGFLNTFKKGRELSDSEREHYYKEEETKYHAEGITEPYILTASNIDDLKNETLYNYVLFPDGTIRVSLEKPNGNDSFQYPNHTILAGNPHQLLVAAGSFILYKSQEKRLFFISNKSGHFQPEFYSLEFFRTQLVELGVNPYTIVQVPDVDLTRVLLNAYPSVRTPIFLTTKDSEGLFNIALKEWNATYQTIDKDFIAQLAQGNAYAVNSKEVVALNKQREEGTYMRNAYNLFTAEHKTPKTFHALIKRLGKLKDALYHQVPGRIKYEAKKVLDLMDRYENEEDAYVFTPADDHSIYKFLQGNLAEIKELCSHDRLPVDEYHQLKKLTRELGTLFMYMYKKAKGEEKGFLINRTISRTLFKINSSMVNTLDEYVAKDMRDELNKAEDFYISLAPKITKKILLVLSHLDLAPPKFKLEMTPLSANKAMHFAKTWYQSHYSYLSNEKHPKQAGSHSSLSQRGYTLLQTIYHGEYDSGSSDQAAGLLELKKLSRDAEIARNMLIFIDASHQAPESLNVYIKELNKIIHDIENNRAELAWKSAFYMMGQHYKPFPTDALENWQCTDQTSFNETVAVYLKAFSILQNQTYLSKKQQKKVIDYVQAFRDLICIYRKMGSSNRTGNLPNVCYDVLQEHLDELLEEVHTAAANLNNGQLTVTPQMKLHADYILSKIQS